MGMFVGNRREDLWLAPFPEQETLNFVRASFHAFVHCSLLLSMGVM